MKRETVLAGLTAINLALVGGTWMTRISPAAAQGDGVLRGTSLEIVDAQGRLRASITIQPPAEGVPETALFRLISPNGQPSVKIGASITSAGLSFVGGDDESHVILEADGPRSRMKMVGPNGSERLIAP